MPMTEKTTQSKLSEYREKLKGLKPHSRTLDTILAFAATYQAERLSDGRVAGYFLNGI
jgi:hypothetical protein